MRPSRSTLAAVAAGSLLTLGVGGAAVLASTGALAADSPSASVSPAASGSAAAPGSGAAKGPGGRFGHGPGMGMGLGRGFGGSGMLGGDVLHGDIVVKKADGSGTETLLVQHGAITAKGSNTVTIKSSDGFTLTWTVTSTTIIPGPRPVPGNRGTATTPPANGTLADLAVGADVQALGTKSGDGATARMIHTRPTLPAGTPGQPAPGQSTPGQGTPGQGGPGWWGPGHGHGRGVTPNTPGATPSAKGASYLGI